MGIVASDKKNTTTTDEIKKDSVIQKNGLSLLGAYSDSGDSNSDND